MRRHRKVENVLYKYTTSHVMHVICMFPPPPLSDSTVFPLQSYNNNLQPLKFTFRLNTIIALQHQELDTGWTPATCAVHYQKIKVPIGFWLRESAEKILFHAFHTKAFPHFK